MQVGVGDRHWWHLLSEGSTGGIHPLAKAEEGTGKLPWMCPVQAVPCHGGDLGQVQVDDEDPLLILKQTHPF